MNINNYYKNWKQLNEPFHNCYMAQKWNLEFFSETHYICKSVHKTSPRTLFFMFVACPACWRNTCVQSAHAGTTKKVFLLEFNFNRIQEKRKKCFAFLFFCFFPTICGHSGNTLVTFFALWNLLLPPGSTARSFFLLLKNSEQCTDGKQIIEPAFDSTQVSGS